MTLISILLISLLLVNLIDTAPTDIVNNDQQSNKPSPGKLSVDYTLPSARLRPGEQRPAGTLLLNMLVKNEADNLLRTLPEWSKLPIDCYVIGVDEHNNDNTIDIINKYLGHIKHGYIHTVRNFESIGQSWNELVQIGVDKFNNTCTHGILADADFMPLFNIEGQFDKNTLDIRCSKHMYTIHTQDGNNHRFVCNYQKHLQYIT